MFDRERFWDIIETSRQSSMTGQYGFQDEWQSAISQLKDAQLAEAAHISLEQAKRAATPGLYEAYTLHTANQEDHGFARYCEWVICHGHDTFEAAIKNPDALSSKTQPRCRWQDTNLYQSVLMFIGIRSRFRPTVAIAQFQQNELQEPHLVLTRAVAEALAPELGLEIHELCEAGQIDSLLRLHMNVDTAQAAARHPNLAAGYQAACQVRPLLDRRSPMNIEKFWHIMGLCRELGSSPLDLRSLLGLLPSQQVAQFHELLQACIANAYASPLAVQAVETGAPQQWFFALALEGSDVYRQSVGSGIPTKDIKPASPEVLRVAPEVFRSQTGMELPPLSIHMPIRAA